MSLQTEHRPPDTGRAEQPVTLGLASATVPGAGESRRSPPGTLAAAAAAAALVRGNSARAVALARQLGQVLPPIGGGDTRVLFETLATLAAVDLTAARVVEAHLDALGILHQAGVSPDQFGPATVPARAARPHATDAAPPAWGVFAAEASGLRLEAAPGEAGAVHPVPARASGRASDHASGISGGPGSDTGGTWRLDGTKPWCSLAGTLSHALVTAHTSETTRRLFAVDLRQAGIGVRPGGWVALGLPSVPSGPVDFAAVRARPIGSDGWYLTRPGFAWGGIAVAACWFGGTVGVARQLHAALSASTSREPDQVALAHLGAIDILLIACARALDQAAAAIDSGAATGPVGALLAARVRGLVARTTEEVLSRVGHALGPTPLAFDARHAQRVADLHLYVRQHHAERDDAALGRLLLHPTTPGTPGSSHSDGISPNGGSTEADGAPW